MSVSGVKCDDEVAKTFEEFKKNGSQIAYMACKIENGVIKVADAPTRVDGDEDVDDKGVPAEYKKLESAFIAAKCLYGVYRFKWESSGGHRDVVVLIKYCDDNAPAKMKMTYSTSVGAIKNKGVTGWKVFVEASDKDGISYHEILDHCKKTTQ